MLFHLFISPFPVICHTVKVDCSLSVWKSSNECHVVLFKLHIIGIFMFEKPIIQVMEEKMKCQLRENIGLNAFISNDTSV